MALLRSAVAAFLCATTAADRPSLGCTGSSHAWVPKGNGDSNTIDIEGQPPREFIIDAVAGAQDAEAAPLLFSFHGQYGTAARQRLAYHFEDVASDVIVVYPQGLDDFVPDDPENPDVGTGWNVGTAGDNMTCIEEDMDGNSCYASCQAQGKCGPCDWSTCYDDVLFVRKTLELVTQNLCVDLDRVYVHGGSNGGMLTFHLLQEMPDVFAAAVPQYSLPLVGYEIFPLALDHTAVFALYDRWDSVIPWGPLSVNEASGWLFASLATVMTNLAALHGCALEAEVVATPWDGGLSNFECAEYQACRSGKRVLQCFYDGVHGSNPKGNSTQGDLLTADIIMWFLRPFSRGLNETAPATSGQSAWQAGNASGTASVVPSAVPPRRLRSSSHGSQ